MKRIISLFFAAVMLCSSTACTKQNQKEPVPTIEPQITQMKTICELAVMECYYHNVAKYYEEDANKGFLGFGKKDKHFWIEYSGVVKLGIDASLLRIEVADEQIIITLPEAKVLGCKVDSASLSADSFIVDKKSAPIEAADEVKAFDEAQSKLEADAASDQALLSNAQQRAQVLLEEYISNIGAAVGKQYTIKWVYVDAQGTPQSSVITESAPSAESASAK